MIARDLFVMSAATAQMAIPNADTRATRFVSMCPPWGDTKKSLKGATMTVSGPYRIATAAGRGVGLLKWTCRGAGASFSVHRDVPYSPLMRSGAQERLSLYRFVIRPGTGFSPPLFRGSGINRPPPDLERLSSHPRTGAFPYEAATPRLHLRGNLFDGCRIIVAFATSVDAL